MPLDLRTRSILKSCALIALTALAASAALAEGEPVGYQLPITRNGETKLRLAYTFWSGEYPLPVIDLNSKKKGGKTKIQALASLRDLSSPKLSCTVKNGLYNPWSHTANSVINYYSIVPIRSYRALVDVTFDASSFVPAGGLVDNIIYQAENRCQATLKVAGQPGRYIEFGCEQVMTPEFVNLTPVIDAGAEEQWMYVKCAEGYNAFVNDEALLAQKKTGVKQGEIVDLGVVTGAK